MSVIDQIKEKFGDKVDIFVKSKKRAYVTVAKENAKDVVRYCFRDLGARFSIASGVDTRLGVEILYHMTFDRHDMIITVKVLVKKPELEMESFTDFMPAANWIEREIHEMFGVNFIGHPDLRKLLLADDWPEGKYPLRKEEFQM